MESRKLNLRTVMVVAGAAAFSTRDVWEGYVQGLSQLGLEVLPYPTFSMRNVLSAEMVGNDIIGKSLDVRNAIDAVIFTDGLFFRLERRWIIETLSHRGVLTALIATEDPYEPLLIEDNAYTVRFTNELSCVDNGAIYLPTATCFPPNLTGSKQDKDIIFIGTVFPDRWPLLRQLGLYCEDHAIRFDICGHFLVDTHEFDNSNYVLIRPGTVQSSEKWREYASAKIVLNIFRDGGPNAISANPRIYEVAALGKATLVTDDSRKEVKKIFEDSLYYFTNFQSLAEQINLALSNEYNREKRVLDAQQIALDGHLYKHRASVLAEVLDNFSGTNVNRSSGRFPAEENTYWIFGSGRSGSTWLLELLGSLPEVAVWHEPYFGALLQHLEDHPSERERPQAFFNESYRREWLTNLKGLFLNVAKSRFNGVSVNSKLVVKEVNAPELAPYVCDMFPSASYILLIRDPFDVLDSQLDMQRVGAWNEEFGRELKLPYKEKVKHTAQHIEKSFRLSMAGFDKIHENKRLQLRYEELLQRPSETLERCAKFLGAAVSQAEISLSIESHSFNKHQQTGQSQFRRFGKAGIWRESETFDDEVHQIAENLLGDLRAELGYE